MYRYPNFKVDERAFVGDVKVKEGSQTQVGFGSYLNSQVELGQGVMIGPGVIITSSGHGIALGKRIKDQPKKEKTVFIEDNVWIGAGAIILAGNRIKEGAVIGAGSVLTEDNIVGENEVWVGNPAKFLRHRE